MKILYSTLLLFLSLNLFSQTPAHEVNKKLGKGVNLGNMFEAPTETEWGNPFKDEYMQKISQMGFNHIRMPIRWDTPARTQQTEPYTINATFLNRVKFVLDLAIKNNLMVVFNMHHHEELFKNPDAQKAKFLSQWRQIATALKDYPTDKVLFEIMNEPNNNLTPDKWNILLREGLAEIRKTNPNRVVYIGTANWGGLGGLPALSLPDDKNIILTIHYYDPFNFTHQGAEWVENSNPWLGTKWGNSTVEREEINGQFAYLIKLSKEKNVPVNIGEFGAYSKADLESRVKWSNYLARWFEQQGFSWAYWEFNAGFGVYNATTDQVLQPLANAIIKDKMTDPVQINFKEIYKSVWNDKSDWVLNLAGTATGDFQAKEGLATVDVTKSSNETWHVQFIKTNLLLEKGKSYLVSFEAKANQVTAVSQYIGKNGAPYNAYSGYKGFSITTDNQKFTYKFTMSDPTDQQARIVFDMGQKVAKFEIKNFKVEEEVAAKPVDDKKVLSSESEQSNIKVFPNPTTDKLQVKYEGNLKKAGFYDIKSYYQEAKIIEKANQEVVIDVSNLRTGLNILVVETDKSIKKIKVIKQ